MVTTAHLRRATTVPLFTVRSPVSDRFVMLLAVVIDAVLLSARFAAEIAEMVPTLMKPLPCNVTSPLMEIERLSVEITV